MTEPRYATSRIRELHSWGHVYCGECGQELEDTHSATTLRKRAIEHAKKLGHAQARIFARRLVDFEVAIQAPLSALEPRPAEASP